MENINIHHDSANNVAQNDMEVDPGQPLLIGPEGRSHLITTAKWALFISIIGFVITAFLLLLGISFMFLTSVISEYQDFQAIQYFPLSMVALGIVYLLSAALCSFPCYYLFTFAKKTKAGIANEEQSSLDEGLKNLKRTFLFVGILTIILLAMLLLAIPTMILSFGMLQALAGGVIA